MARWNSLSIDLDNLVCGNREFVAENRAAASIAQIEVDLAREIDDGPRIGGGPMRYPKAAGLIEPILDAAFELAGVSVFTLRTAVMEAHTLAQRFAPPHRAIQTRRVSVQFVRSLGSIQHAQFELRPKRSVSDASGVTAQGNALGMGNFEVGGEIVEPRDDGSSSAFAIGCFNRDDCGAQFHDAYRNPSAALETKDMDRNPSGGRAKIHSPHRLPLSIPAVRVSPEYHLRILAKQGIREFSCC